MNIPSNACEPWRFAGCDQPLRQYQGIVVRSCTDLCNPDVGTVEILLSDIGSGLHCCNPLTRHASVLSVIPQCDPDLMTLFCHSAAEHSVRPGVLGLAAGAWGSGTYSNNNTNATVQGGQGPWSEGGRGFAGSGDVFFPPARGGSGGVAWKSMVPLRGISRACTAPPPFALLCLAFSAGHVLPCAGAVHYPYIGHQTLLGDGSPSTTQIPPIVFAKITRASPLKSDFERTFDYAFPGGSHLGYVRVKLINPDGTPYHTAGLPTSITLKVEGFTGGVEFETENIGMTPGIFGGGSTLLPIPYY